MSHTPIIHLNVADTRDLAEKIAEAAGRVEASFSEHAYQYVNVFYTDGAVTDESLREEKHIRIRISKRGGHR